MSEVKEVKIHSLGEFIDKVTPKETDSHSGRLRDNAVYRGVADSEWPLYTSLDRLGGTKPAYTKIHLEEDILRNFVRYSHPFLSRPSQSTWELLIIGQHHGLPTRLLDWTYSPIVAAHFATLEKSEAHRVVWKFDWYRAHTEFGIKLRALLIEELGEILTQRGVEDPFDLFRSQTLEEKDFVALLDPPSLDSRVVAQSGTFTLCSRKGVTFDEFLVKHGLTDALVKYVIPKEDVDRFRDQLDLCSLDERRLFPDLDGVASEMKRFYSYSPPTILK